MSQPHLRMTLAMYLLRNAPALVGEASIGYTRVLPATFMAVNGIQGSVDVCGNLPLSWWRKQAVDTQRCCQPQAWQCMAPRGSLLCGERHLLEGF